MANAKDTIAKVQQCTTQEQLQDLLAAEQALDKPRKTVLDAIATRTEELAATPPAAGGQDPEELATIALVDQCTDALKLAELEKAERATESPRRNVLDAIARRHAALHDGAPPATQGKGRQPKATPAHAKAAETDANPFKSMDGLVVVRGRSYTKAEALQRPDVMAVLRKARARCLKGN